MLAQSPDNFGDIPSRDRVIARIFALGGKHNIKVVALDWVTVTLGAQPPCILLQNTHEDFLGGSWIRGAYEHDELACLQMGRDRFCCIDKVAKVRLALLVQRSWDADDYNIHAGDIRVIHRR